MTSEELTLRRLKALSDIHRWKIIVFLMAWGPKPVGLICKHLGMDQPKVSYHLADLRSVGLVRSNRSGRENYYALSKVWEKDEDRIMLLCGGGKVRLEITTQPWIDTE